MDMLWIIKDKLCLALFLLYEYSSIRGKLFMCLFIDLLVQLYCRSYGVSF